MVGRCREKITGGGAGLHPLMIKVAMESPRTSGFGVDAAYGPFVLPDGLVPGFAPVLTPPDDLFGPPPDGARGKLNLLGELTRLLHPPSSAFRETGFFFNFWFAPNKTVFHCSVLL
jgi:hypothetical protein